MKSKRKEWEADAKVIYPSSADVSPRITERLARISGIFFFFFYLITEEKKIKKKKVKFRYSKEYQNLEFINNYINSLSKAPKDSTSES